MDDLLTKQEILGGLPARRASTLLYLIESKTAHGMAHAQQAMDTHLTEKGQRRRDLAFFEAFALGREPPLRPKIQDLEHFAPLWAHLIPDNVRLRAAIAHALGAKYPVSYQRIPKLRGALGLDTEAVEQAYRTQYGEPLSVIYARQETPAEQLRWTQSAIAKRLESLPPFWTVFSLTLTETVGAGILALPIALARVGPRAGILLLVILGLVNILTIAAMAESVTRSGSIRYGNAFYGRVVGEYLGGLGSLLCTLANITVNATALLAFFVGFARVMGDVTRLPVELWAAALFAVCVYFLTRGSLSSTITSALVTGGINILLILILAFLALARLQPANLLSAAAPLTRGQSFDPQVLGLIFGVILVAYCGHNSVGNCGRIVLRRDPGGRSLLWGTVAAQFVAIVLYCLWVAAVQGALAPGQLASYQGTSLELVAAVVGPVARLLGTVYAILAVAMVSVHSALALFNAVRERLPDATQVPPLTVRSLFTRGHFLWSLLPVLLIFAIAEWLLFSHNESFSGLIAFGGVLGASIFTGIFPVLLLAASRRKGDLVPAVVYRLAGHPLLLGAVYLLFLAGIWLHGLVIWQTPVERLAALICGLAVLVMTLLTVKRGAFDRRLVVQFRQNAGDEQALFAVVAGGEALKAEVVATSDQGNTVYHAASGQLQDAASLRRLTFQVTDAAVRELKVWAHKVEVDGISRPLPAQLSRSVASGVSYASLDLSKGPVLVPWGGKDACIELAFRSPDISATAETRGGMPLPILD